MKTVLVTGATGVIGSEVVPLFLNSPGFQVRLLIRAASPAQLQQRLGDLARYWQLDPNDPRLQPPRLCAVPGDVTQPRLGLDQTTYSQLAAQLTHIVHAAGNVKLNQTLSEARRNALLPARHLVTLARACQQHGQFQKLDVVTTIGVAGRLQGRVPERPITQPRSFHNHYEQAKAETEEYLFAEQAAGLPLSIHRPSMVVGRSDNGRAYRQQVFHYLLEFLTGTRTWGFLPDPGDCHIDMAPVDYVARAIYLSAIHPQATGRIFHLCAGPQRAVRLIDLLHQARRSAMDQNQPLPPCRILPRRVFRLAVAVLSMATCGPTRRALAALRYLLPYLETHQQFDVSDTTAFFTPLGCSYPPHGPKPGALALSRGR